MSIQEIFPIEINYKLFFIDKFIKNKKLDIRYNSESRFFFLDSADYNNVGDLAIGLSIFDFLKSLNREIIEIKCEEFPQSFHYLKKVIKKNDIICLTGGGNMGNLYQKYEGIRRVVINTFKNNKIIIFPQTIDYTNSRYGKEQLKRAQKIYNNHKNLIICAREMKSYEIMKKIFYKNTVILTPDIVLSLDISKLCQNKKRNGITTFIRNDKESIFNKEEKELLYEELNRTSIPINISDMIVSEQGQISTEERNKIIINKLNQFKSSKIVITDRLHGMIFSALTETPCIVFSNNNHKVIGVYQWIKELPYIQLVENLDDFSHILTHMINFVNEGNKCIYKPLDFSLLKKQIGD